MASKRTLGIAAAIAVAAVGGIAVAATEMGEKNEVSEKHVALAQVPPPVMAGGRTRLASITKAELVKLKDGRTVYELKGNDKAGKSRELYVATDGKVVGFEHENGKDGDDDD